jgi:hypothetical protein
MRGFAGSGAPRVFPQPLLPDNLGEPRDARRAPPSRRANIDIRRHKEQRPRLVEYVARFRAPQGLSQLEADTPALVDVVRAWLAPPDRPPTASTTRRPLSLRWCAASVRKPTLHRRFSRQSLCRNQAILPKHQVPAEIRRDFRRRQRNRTLFQRPRKIEDGRNLSNFVLRALADSRPILSRSVPSGTPVSRHIKGTCCAFGCMQAMRDVRAEIGFTPGGDVRRHALLPVDAMPGARPGENLNGVFAVKAHGSAQRLRANGVDQTLIRACLRETPLECLQMLEEMHQLAESVTDRGKQIPSYD